MTISATAHPETTPPSNTVDVSITSGYVMSALAIYRNDSNGRTLLRTQPAAGFDSRTATDYECPYEQNVTYDWTATYTDPTAYSTVFNETWASTASWTASTGTANVSGSTVRNTTTAAILYRAVSVAKYRVTITSMSASDSGALATVYLNEDSASTTGSTDSVRLSVGGGDLTVRVVIGGSTVSTTTTAIDESQPITVDFGSTTITVTGTGGSVVLPYNLSLGWVSLALVGLSANQATIGAIKVQSYGTPATISETSSAVNLAPDDAWLVHPGTVALSMPLSDDDMGAASIVDIDPVGNETNATVHRILGSATPVPTTTGPRSDDRTTLTLATITTSEAVALRALLAPDVPLLIQVPPSWDLDFNSGFYQVGDTTSARRDDLNMPRRTWSLPLQKVQSPVVDVENTGWSYAAAAVEFATYTDLTGTFATYADLAANTRI